MLSYTLNPKCVSMGELYGEYSPLTSEWKDGLASSLIRSAVNDATPAQKWVVFDGPVDALWIENLNTVRPVSGLSHWLLFVLLQLAVRLQEAVASQCHGTTCTQSGTYLYTTQVKF